MILVGLIGIFLVSHFGKDNGDGATEANVAK